MVTKKQSKKSSIELSTNVQIAFIVSVILAWLAPVVYIVIWMTNGYINNGSLLIQISYLGLPLLFLLAAMANNYGKFARKLHYAFMSFFYAMIGVTAYGALASIESALRYRFYPPKIADFNNTSLLTAFGHEWLIMSIGLFVFIAVLIMMSRKRKA